MSEGSGMVGREVRAPWDGEGVVVKWDPLTAATCDTLVRFPCGKEVWHASHTLCPTGEMRGIPLPSREERQREAKERAVAQLKTIRSQHVRDMHKPWPGLEFAKTLFGRAVDGAIDDLEE